MDTTCYSVSCGQITATHTVVHLEWSDGDGISLRVRHDVGRSALTQVLVDVELVDEIMSAVAEHLADLGRCPTHPDHSICSACWSTYGRETCHHPDHEDYHPEEGE